MKVFIISRDGKEVERETCSDCSTVEQFANRKFGSHDFAKSKITIKMVDPVPPKKAEAKPAEAKPAEAKPAEAKPAEAPAEAKPAEAKPAEAPAK